MDQSERLRFLYRIPFRSITSLPWSDCKVCFPMPGWEYVEEDREEIILDRIIAGLPASWEHDVTESCGASGYVIIFRVTGLLHVHDGESVRDLIRKEVFSRIE